MHECTRDQITAGEEQEKKVGLKFWSPNTFGTGFSAWVRR